MGLGRLWKRCEQGDIPECLVFDWDCELPGCYLFIHTHVHSGGPLPVSLSICLSHIAHLAISEHQPRMKKISNTKSIPTPGNRLRELAPGLTVLAAVPA
jgi:hypothetical protein